MPLREGDGGADEVAEAVRVSEAIRVSEAVGVVEAVGVRQLGHEGGEVLGKRLIQCKTR